MMDFYTGLHMPNHAMYFDRCFISINRLEKRKSNFLVKDWIMDSGAFTRIISGKGHMPVDEYAEHIKRWKDCGNLKAAVCQDYMCEDFVLNITGLCIGDHQAMTIENYIQLQSKGTGVYIMPVLQGYEPDEYVEHIKAYGEYLEDGAWCGVGSVCKRNSRIHTVEAVLSKIKQTKPDLKLHGFGLKQTALKSGLVRSLLHSADSMAWSFAARKRGGDSNDWKEAKMFEQSVKHQEIQLNLFEEAFGVRRETK
jgi:hypothetical protein